MLFRAFVSSLVIVILILGTIFFEKKAMHASNHKQVDSHVLENVSLFIFWNQKIQRQTMKVCSCSHDCFLTKYVCFLQNFETT